MKISFSIASLAFVVLIANSYASPVGRTGIQASTLKKSNDFLAPQSVAVIVPGTAILIDCRHYNTTLKTALLFSRSLHESFVDITSRSNVEIIGQVFTIRDVTWMDDGYYMCARQDKKGMAMIMLEVFVVEEADIYNSCVLKHRYENETFGSLEVCKKYLKANAAEREYVCGMKGNKPINNNGSIGAEEDLERIQRSFTPLIIVWRHTTKVFSVFKGCIEATLQMVIDVCHQVHHTTQWIKTCTFTVYENGIWSLTSPAKSCINRLESSIKRLPSSITENIAEAYEKGLWNTLCDIASWYRTQFYTISTFAKRVVFYIRDTVANVAIFMDRAIYAALKAKDITKNFILDQLQILSEEKARITTLVSSYSQGNFIDTLKTISSDILTVNKRLFAWIFINTRDLIILYKSVISHSMSSIKEYAKSRIPENHVNEFTQYVHDLITWLDDVITVIQLAITWLMYNIAMAILKISEFLDPSSDATFTSPYGREAFWEASRMGLVESSAEVTWSLLTSVIFSKMMRIIVNGAVIYRNAIFSKHDMAYNMVVVFVYVGIYMVCRLKSKIEVALKPLMDSMKRQSQSFWRRCSKKAAHKHHILLLTPARRTKMLYKRFLPTVMAEKEKDIGDIVTVDRLGLLNELYFE